MRTGLVGPIVLTGTIHVRTAAGVREVSVRFPPGQPITERDILLQLGKALAKVRRDIDPDAELFDALEFFNGVLIVEKFGQPGAFDLPESFDFDRDAVQSAALVAACCASMPAAETVQ